MREELTCQAERVLVLKDCGRFTRARTKYEAAEEATTKNEQISGKGRP